MNRSNAIRTLSAVVACLAVGVTGVAGTAMAGETDGAVVSASTHGKPKPLQRKAVVPSTKTIFGWIKDLTSVGYRRTGTPGGRRAAEYVHGKFKRFGLQKVQFQRAQSFSWSVRNHSLSVEGSPLASFPIAHSVTGFEGTGKRGTGPDGLDAELVDVGNGDFTGKDVAGKIVVFNLKFTELPIPLFRAVADFNYDPGNTVSDSDKLSQPYITNFTAVATKAMDGGAAGMVGVLADYFDSDKYFNEYYRRLDMKIPGVWVKPSVGSSLRSQMAGKPGATANLKLNVTREPATARNVIGFLPGRSKETILISSHHDAVFKGAVEDASGTSEVLALAKYFGAMKQKQREKSLMFATMDSHFTGYQAHDKFLKKYVSNVPQAKRPVANLAIEHIARQGVIEDGKLRMTNQPEITGILHNVGPDALESIKKEVVANDLDRTTVLPAGVFGGAGIPTDASGAYALGVPVVSLISGPVYLYDKQDTPDKVFKPHLRPVAKAFAQIATDMGPMTREEIAQGE